MAFVVVALNCCFLDGPVHAFNLTVGPRMLDLGEPVLNAMFMANPVKDVLEGEAVSLLIGELDAIVGEDDVNFVGNSGDQIAQELRGQHLAGLAVQFEISKLAGSINGNKEIEFSLCCLNFGNVDMEIADWVGFELLLWRLVALDIRQPGNAIPLQTTMQ